MTETPTTIHLYYLTSPAADNISDEQQQQQQQPSLLQLYREFLQKQGHHESTVETNLSTNPALYKDLQHRFPNLSCPGILLNDTVWVNGNDVRELQAAWGKAWFDHVLHKHDSQNDITTTMTTTTLPPATSSDDQNSVDFPDSILKNGNNNKASITQSRRPSLAQLQEQFNASLRSADDTTTSPNTSSLHTSCSSTTSSMLAHVALPNGKNVEVGALTRLLMRSTHHNYVERYGNRFFYFRGCEGMELWSMLFFEDDHHKTEDFGRMLIERGILHNYTPNCTELSKTFLVLRPLKEPRVLNSFVKCPAPQKSTSNQTETDDTTASIMTNPMEVLLHLSRLMDEICATDYRENWHMYHEFETGVCQLQVLPFPSDQRERVTFVLNLYNMAVRHAVICCGERRWNWPTDLEALHAFFSKIGYTINGTWVSLAELQAILYGNTGVVMPQLLSERSRFFRRWSCRPHTDSLDLAPYYATKVIQTDPRLLFAMSFGTLGSPAVATIYPNRLHEGLQTAGEVFAREHVKITEHGVELPVLTGWFRHDLGGTPDLALHFLLPFLSVEQMRGLDDLWRCGAIDIKFSREHNWKAGLVPLSPSSANKMPPTDAAISVSLSSNQMSTGIALADIRETDEGKVVSEQAASVSQSSKGTKALNFSDKASLLEEFSIEAAPELLYPGPEDMIDPTPLQSPSASIAASKSQQKTSPSSALSSSSNFGKTSLARQSTSNKPTLLRRLWGRYPSVGDFAPRRPGLHDKTETHSYDDDDDDYNQSIYSKFAGDDYSDAGGSFFQSVVSEITYGSEFQDIMGRRLRR